MEECRERLRLPSTYLIFTQINYMKKDKKQKGFTLLYSVLISSIVLAASLSIINIALKQHKLSALSRESQVAFYAANTGIDCAIYWEAKKRAVTDAGGANEVELFPRVSDNEDYDDPLNNGDNDDGGVIRTDDDSDTEIHCLGEDILESEDFYGTSGDPLDEFHNFSSRNWEDHIQFATANDLDEYCLEETIGYNDDYRAWIFQVVLPSDDGTYSKNNACAVVSVCKNLDAATNGGYSTIYTAKGYNTCDISKENVVERGVILIQN